MLAEVLDILGTRIDISELYFYQFFSFRHRIFELPLFRCGRDMMLGIFMGGCWA